MKALIISADNFEDSELLVPYYRLKEADIEVTVASLSSGSITGKRGYAVTVDKTLEEVNPDDYAILILPGGKAPQLIPAHEDGMARLRGTVVLVLQKHFGGALEAGC